MDTNKILLLKSVIITGGEVEGVKRDPFTIEEVEELINELNYEIVHSTTQSGATHED